MDNLESKVPSEPAPIREEAALARQVDSLRQTLISVLVLVIVISGTINIYLFRQVNYTRADLKAFRTSATGVIAQFEKESAPIMRNFFSQLLEFGKGPGADETFRSIINRYNLAAQVTNANQALPPQTPAAPAPAK